MQHSTAGEAVLASRSLPALGGVDERLVADADGEAVLVRAAPLQTMS